MKTLMKHNAKNHINILGASYFYVTHINYVKVKEKFSRSLSITPFGIINSRAIRSVLGARNDGNLWRSHVALLNIHDLIIDVSTTIYNFVEENFGYA